MIFPETVLCISDQIKMVGNQLWVRNVMVPFREILQMAQDLLSAKPIKDFFAWLWLARSSFSKKVSLAARKTLLYISKLFKGLK